MNYQVKRGRFPSFMQFIVGCALIFYCVVFFIPNCESAKLGIKVFIFIWLCAAIVTAGAGLYNFLSDKRITEYEIKGDNRGDSNEPVK